MPADALPVACSLSGAEMRARREGLLAELRDGVEEERRVRGGWAFRFPARAGWMEKLAKVADLERECCPFLRFRITAEAGGGPVWLEMTGPRGTARFIRTEMGLRGPG